MSAMEDIEKYVLELTNKYSAINSIWLFGSRANNSFNDNSDWDLLVFADKETLKALRSDSSFISDKIDLFVIYNGNDAENPYADRDGRRIVKKLTLTNLNWNEVDNGKAKYRHVKYKDETERFKNGNFEVKILDAHRIWSK